MCLCKTQICVAEKQKPVDAEDKMWYDICVGAVFRPVFAGSARWQCVTDPRLSFEGFRLVLGNQQEQLRKGFPPPDQHCGQ